MIRNMGDVKSAIERRLRQQIGLPNSLITDSEIMEWGNYGYRLTNLELGLLRRQHIITVSAGSSHYPLASAVSKPIIGINLITYNNEKELQQRSKKYIIRVYGKSWVNSGVSKFFFFTDPIFTTVYFVPHSITVGDTYEIDYIYRPDEITDWTTEFAIPQEYCESIVEWTWWPASLESRDKSTFALLSQGVIAPAFFSSITVARKQIQQADESEIFLVPTQDRYDPYSI